MANRILFATETVKTSQGWFEPGQLLPKEDLPIEEIEMLLESKQAGECAFNSPLAAFVHEARKMPTKGQATMLIQGALGTVSAEAPPDDPTPEGEFPSLERYVDAGYQAENYEAAKTNFYERKDEEAKAALKAASEAKDAEQRTADAEAAKRQMQSAQDDGGEKKPSDNDTSHEQS